MRSFFIYIFLSLLFSASTKAQVGGISASKLSAYNTKTVPANNIEFEPSLNFTSSRYMWDDSGKQQSIFSTNDSNLIESDFLFRFTYGLFKNVETGVSVSSDISIINWGVKYHFLTLKKTSLSLIGGVNMPIGNHISSTSNRSSENTLAGGLVLTRKWNEDFSLDINLQYQKHLFETTEIKQQDIFLNAEAGYYFADKIQIVCGFIGYFSNNVIQSENVAFVSGITIEKAKNFILVLQAPYSFAGLNSLRNIGFNLALTILLD